MSTDSISLLLFVVNYSESCANKLLNQLIDTEAFLPSEFTEKEENINSLCEIMNRPRK